MDCWLSGWSLASVARPIEVIAALAPANGGLAAAHTLFDELLADAQPRLVVADAKVEEVLEANGVLVEVAEPPCWLGPFGERSEAVAATERLERTAIGPLARALRRGTRGRLEIHPRAMAYYPARLSRARWWPIDAQLVELLKAPQPVERSTIDQWLTEVFGPLAPMVGVATVTDDCVALDLAAPGGEPA